MRNRVFIGTCRVALALASFALIGCKQDVAFTRTPIAGMVEPDSKPADTRLFLSTPVNLAPLLQAVEAAVGPDMARWRETLEGAACDRRRTQWLECMPASATISLTRKGPAEAVIEGSRLLVMLPVSYEVNAKGIGWAAYMAETKVGQISVGVPFDVVLGPGYRLNVRMGDGLVWSEKAVAVLRRGKVWLAGGADARLKSQLRAVAGPLREAIASQPIRETTERAWTALHAPIQLIENPSLWLRGLPERVAGAGFGVEQGQFVYRIAFDCKVQIHRGDRPTAMMVRPLPEPAQLASTASKPASNKTLLTLPFDVAAPGFEEAIAAAFPKTDLIETRADARSTPVKLRTVGVQLFPARDRVALELQLDVVEPRRLLGLTGKAYLLGRPVLDVETGVLELRDIAFPPTPRAPRNGPSVTLSDAPGPLARIGQEPFASRFAAAARLNVKGPLDTLLPKLNKAIRQNLEQTIELNGAFEQATVRSVEPIRGGFRFNLDLVGVLSLRSHAVRAPGGAMQATGSVAPMQRRP